MTTKSLIYQKKKKALDLFVKSLLKSSAGKDIARIILFGSLAKGDVDEYSDVDVLLFGKNVKKIEDAAWEASLDSFEQFEESIEPLVYPVSKVRKPDSYFLYHSMKTGKQLHP